MLKIACCDDEKKDRDIIINALTQIETKWKEKFEISSFSNGESLCESISKNHYNVILLDIIMNGIDGIEVATRIRAMGEENLIIFISSYDKRVKELFDYRTIAFLDKPFEVSKLEEALLKAYSILKKDNDNFFSFCSKSSKIHIPIKEIISFESKRNEIIVHTIKNDESVYATLSSVWAEVKNLNQFIMPHRSFIFNMNYVSIKSEQIIIRKTGESFNIGKIYKDDTQKRYITFLESRCK